MEGDKSYHGTYKQIFFTKWRKVALYCDKIARGLPRLDFVKSRNDERVERLYFLQKQNEAKTFSGCASRIFILFGYFGLSPSV